MYQWSSFCLHRSHQFLWLTLLEPKLGFEVGSGYSIPLVSLNHGVQVGAMDVLKHLSVESWTVDFCQDTYSVDLKLYSTSCPEIPICPCPTAQDPHTGDLPTAFQDSKLLNPLQSFSCWKTTLEERIPLFQSIWKTLLQSINSTSQNLSASPPWFSH